MKIVFICIISVVFFNTTIFADSLSVGQRFHRETSFDESGFVGKNISWGKRIPLYKKYPDAQKTKLPAPSFTGQPVERVIGQRKSTRSFSDKPITLAELSQLLLSANGLTHTSGSFEMRAAPSGGALYPVELYVIVHNVESLDNGLYHFQVADSSLELIKAGDFSRKIHEAANNQNAVGKSPLTVVLTARFARSTVKYADRGYRYIYIETGAICENIYLQATSLDMGTVAVGAFNDGLLNELLELDGLAEAALLIMPVGHIK